MKTDMTVGSPIRHIVVFMIPLLVGNTFQQLYNMVDTVIVGRYLGVDSLAAVGSAGSLIFLINGFAIGLTAGFSIIISQHYGAAAYESVKRDFAAAIVMGMIGVAVLTVISVCFSRQMPVLMQTPAGILSEADQYLKLIYGGMAATMLFNLLSNALRAIGDSRMPLIFLVVSCVANIILDILFISAFGMGVTGAALATVLAQLLSVVCCVFYIAKHVEVLHPVRESFHFDWGDVRKQIKMGGSMGFQSSIISIGGILVQTSLNRLGAIYVASYTAASKIESIVHMPLISFGLTMATYVGQNYGANDLDRIRKGVRQCLILSVVFSLVTGVALILFGYHLAGIFVPGETKMMENAQIFLNISGGLLFVLAILYVIRYSLQGLGQSMIPTVAGIMELIMRATAALAMSKVWGFTGICWANPLAWIGACIPLCIAYVVTIKKMIYLQQGLRENRCMFYKNERGGEAT